MTTPAKALVFISPERRFELREYPAAAPTAANVRLRLRRSGICGTDMHFVHGTLELPPGERILGHEFIGTVEALGDGVKNDARGEAIAVGDAALVCVAIPCGVCPNCGRGETSSCMDFGVTYQQDPEALVGGFASRQFAPATNVVRLPAGVDPDAAAAFCCAGPTVVRAFAYGGPVIGGEAALVQGTGAMGLFAIAWIRAHGGRVIATGSLRNDKRVDLARRFGAETVLDYRAPRAERLAAVREFSGGRGVDLAIETSGAPASFAEALEALRIRGRYLVPGQYSNSGGVEIQPQLVTFKALRITGSGQYNLDDVRDYLAFLDGEAERTRLFRECVTVFALEDYERAFAVVEAGDCVKAAFALS